MYSMGTIRQIEISGWAIETRGSEAEPWRFVGSIAMEHWASTANVSDVVDSANAGHAAPLWRIVRRADLTRKDGND